MCRTLAEKADAAHAQAEPHVKVTLACQLGCRGAIHSLQAGTPIFVSVCYISTSAPF